MKQQIDSEIERRVNEAVAANEASGEFKNLMVYQKLKDIMADLGTNQGIHQLWKDVSPEEQAQYLSKINISFDTENGMIEVSSKALDTHDKPIYDWKFDSGIGSMSSVRREHDHEEIAPSTPTDAAPVTTAAAPVASEPQVAVKPVTEVKTISKTPAKKLDPNSPEWQDMEMQRDIAFKIVYFFIGFIAMTFGLLYAYYKIDQKAQEEE